MGCGPLLFAWAGGKRSVLNDITGLLEPALQDMGFELVQVRLLGSTRRTLQVMAEPSDGRAMTVDDCAEISTAISALLDVADPVDGAYALEVSSPGLDRPLVKPRDFERFKGNSVRIETSEPIGDRRRFKGVLAGLAEDRVVVKAEGVTHELPLALVRRAKLLITEELLRLHQPPAGRG